MRELQWPRRSNCFFWACWRIYTEGGYVAFRRSQMVPFKLHFLWSRNRRYWWGYSPVNPKQGMAALSHGVWFKGKIRKEQ